MRFHLILCFTPFAFEVELFWVRFVPQAVSVDYAASCPSSPAQAPVRPSSFLHLQTRCRGKSRLAKTARTDVSIRSAHMPHGYRSTGRQHPCLPLMYHVRGMATYTRLRLCHTTQSPNTYVYCNFYYRSASAFYPCQTPNTYPGQTH